MSGERAHIIVFGNEKGGSGKTTAAMHVAVALARLGKRVASDRSRQPAEEPAALCGEPAGMVRPQGRGSAATRRLHRRAHLGRFARCRRRRPRRRNSPSILEKVSGRADFVLIDTPGSDTPLSRLAHAEADTLVTPMNDSFVDFDLLARIDPDELQGHWAPASTAISSGTAARGVCSRASPRSTGS